MAHLAVGGPTKLMGRGDKVSAASAHWELPHLPLGKRVIKHNLCQGLCETLSLTSLSSARGEGNSLVHSFVIKAVPLHHDWQVQSKRCHLDHASVRGKGNSSHAQRYAESAVSSSVWFPGSLIFEAVCTFLLCEGFFLPQRVDFP